MAGCSATGACYWVGGTGNASDTTKWATTSGGATTGGLPTAADNVIFDALSHNDNYTFTVDAAMVCKDFTMDKPTGVGKKVTWAGTSTLAISGSLNLSGGTAGITRTYTGDITYNATSGVQLITSNGTTCLSNVIFNGAGGTRRLADAMIIGGAKGITNTAGTFDATTNTAMVTFNGTAHTITPTAAMTFYDLTRTGTTAKTNTFTLAGDIIVSHTLALNGNSATNRMLFLSSSIGTPRSITITGTTGNTFSNVDFKDIAMVTGGADLDLSTAALCAGFSGDCGGNSGITFTTSELQTWKTAAGGSWSGANWTGNAGAISGAADNGSTKVRYTTSAPHLLKVGQQVTVAGMGRAEYNVLQVVTLVSDTTHFDSAITYTADADVTGTYVGNDRVPLPQDDVSMAIAFDASSTVTQDMPRAGRSIDWTNVTGTPTWTTNVAASIFGSLTLAATSSMTLTASTQAYTFEGRGNYTLTSAGQTFAKNITLNAPGGKLTFVGNFLSSASLLPFNGTWDAATNNIDLQFTTFSSAGTGTKVVDMGTGTWTLIGTGTVWEPGSSGSITINKGSSTIKVTNTSATAITFLGRSFTYNNLWFSRGASTGTITISGNNIFNDFKDDGTEAHSILFNFGTTQTVASFTVSGTAGKLITLNSTTTGVYYLAKSGGLGNITSTYVDIYHSVATPSYTWYASTGSVNHQSTATAGSGWVFEAPPTPVSALKTRQEYLNALIGTTGTLLTVQEALNVLAGTTGMSAQGAANVWAGTTGLTIQEAINVKCGTTGLSTQEALRYFVE